MQHAVSKIHISHSPLFVLARARARRVSQLEAPAGKTCFNVMYMFTYMFTYRMVHVYVHGENLSDACAHMQIVRL